MNRRELLVGAGSTAVAAGVSAISAKAPLTQDHIDVLTVAAMEPPETMEEYEATRVFAWESHPITLMEELEARAFVERLYVPTPTGELTYFQATEAGLAELKRRGISA